MLIERQHECMKFHYGRSTFKNKARAQEQCYLLSNGLGGYSSMSIAQSLTRNDHGFFIACPTTLTKRYVLVSKLIEVVYIAGEAYEFTSQQFVNHTKNQNGEQYIIRYEQDILPTWTYMIKGVMIKKKMVMVHGENTIAVSYEVHSDQKNIKLEVFPAISFCAIGERVQSDQTFVLHKNTISSHGMTMYMHSSCNGVFQKLKKAEFVHDVYYQDDARDGRDSVGAYTIPVCIPFEIANNAHASLIFTLEDTIKRVTTYIQEEEKRVHDGIVKAGISSPLGKALVRASDNFIVRKDKVHSKTILAGYPFFNDWGRDTMIAIEGCCISTCRFEEAKEIFRSFVGYIKKGLLPNVFAPKGQVPMYNTVDASLLYIQAVYHYYCASQDIVFIKEEMMVVIQDILKWYQKGTMYAIKMDEDYLIQAGSDLDQVTWMDVRYKRELPTPRHGKAVEVNAYWYNALSIYVYFKHVLHEDAREYEEMLEKVKVSFNTTFWNDDMQCLKDVVSNSIYDTQLRCNQIWAVSVPFSPLPLEKAKLVVQCVYEKLYTPYGLRTLACDDPQFVGEYSGSLYKRDMSYHQGSVWVFPLGSYFRAYLKVHGNSAVAKAYVREQLAYFEDALMEGCVGQLPELYDGLDPHTSRGCFAQAWSVGEILKICKEVG